MVLLSISAFVQSVDQNWCESSAHEGRRQRRKSPQPRPSLCNIFVGANLHARDVQQVESLSLTRSQAVAIDDRTASQVSQQTR